MKKVAIFHTTSKTLDLLTELCKKFIPDIEVMHIVEDSMIKEIMAHNCVTASINARIAAYINIAETANCDLFMSACSSIGEAVEQCQFMSKMLLTRIDTAMIEQAIKIGGTISVLATVETTLRPTLNYIQRLANTQNNVLNIKPLLMADAYYALLNGETKKHNDIIKAGLLNALKQSDVIILAQASMAGVIDTLDELPLIPILTSPESGIKWLKTILFD